MSTHPFIRMSLPAALALALAAAPALAEPPADAFPAEGEAAKVKLVSAGEGEKTALRWKGEEGASEKLRMSFDMDMTMEAPGVGEQKMAMRMSLDADGSVGAATDDRSEITLKFVDADLEMEMPGVDPAQSSAAVEQVRTLMEDVTVKGSVDARGLEAKLDVEADDGLAQMLQGLDQAMSHGSLPWPEEPIGVGAKWEVFERDEMNGVDIRTHAIYELVSLEGTRAGLKVEMTLHAASKQIDAGGGQMADITRFASSGSGTLEVDLTKPLMATGDIALTMDLALEMQGQQMTSAMKIATTMARREE